MVPVHASMLKKPSRGTYSLVYQTNSTFIISRIVDSKLVEILFTNTLQLMASCHQQHFTHASFCFFRFFHFHRIPFRGLAGACVNPGSIFLNSLFVHSIVTHTFLIGFQPNFVQHFSHVYSTCHTIFSLKYKHLNVFESHYTAG